MAAYVLPGDCRELLRCYPDNHFDACVCDPPYHLTSIVKRFGSPTAAPALSNGATGVYGRSSRGFMGKVWDGGDLAFRPETWAEVYRVLKPGAHLVAFGGTRTYHRLACAIEDAGFEIRDALTWLYGQGFPKSHPVGKAIDKAAGAKREVVGSYTVSNDIRGGNFKKGSATPLEVNVTVPATAEAALWEGWGTALKPGAELIALARKPLVGTVAGNVLAHGTGAINIDACRVATKDDNSHSWGDGRRPGGFGNVGADKGSSEPCGQKHDAGRWPANIVHDGSDEVIEAFAAYGQRGAAAPVRGHEPSRTGSNGIYNRYGRVPGPFHGDTGTAARFFYCAKATKTDRAGSKHPTIKPVTLMRWLLRLVVPPGGHVVDPFAGSGTTGQAAAEEGFHATLIEREAEYVADIRRRLAA